MTPSPWGDRMGGVRTPFSTPGFRILAKAAGRRRFLAWMILVSVLVAGMLAVAWVWPGPVGASGGLPFPGELVIGIPQFHQGDERWREEKLGDTPGTLGGEGCAVTSASMVLSHYGMKVDPLRLNRFLKEHGGYEGSGWIKWESAAGFTPGLVEKAYEGAASHARIDSNLLKGNPVIVRVRRTDGITHFVVIVGKRWRDYLIRDPSGLGGEGGETGASVSPLSGLGVPVEALRYYRRLSSLQ